MTEKFKILSQYIKDMSSETADIETFLFVKENIRKYQLNIDINSKAIKNNLIEVNVTLKFEDKEPNEKKSYFEIVYATIIRLIEKIEDKKELEKIILSDVPTKIFPNTGIEPIALFMVVAGTKVPLKLISLFFST